MRIEILIFIPILLTTFSCSSQRASDDSSEDAKVIRSTLIQLEERGHLAIDVYPPPSPPPPSRKFLQEKYKNRTTEEINSLYQRLVKNSERDLKDLSSRSVDSSKIFIALSDTLSSACPGCGINVDTLLKQVKYLKYLHLVDQLRQGTKIDLAIPFDKINPAGKYVLKSETLFPDRKALYNIKFDFLFGGEMSFSRFYFNDKIGIIYWTTTQCYRDCSSGYLILLEKIDNDWIIFDILLQYVT